jgi:hypothetical protein
LLYEFTDREHGIAYEIKDSSNQFCLLFISGDNRNIQSVNRIENYDCKNIQRVLTIIEKQELFFKSIDENTHQNNGVPPPPPIPPPVKLIGRCK